MIFIFLSLLIPLIWGARFTGKHFNDDYLSKDTTNVVKGLFIAFVFMSHIQGYIQQSGYGYDFIGDGLYLKFRAFMGQLVVAMFLFYSGYGIMESYKRKGQAYVNTMPRKRLAGTLLNFDIAVIIFMLLNLALGITMSGRQCVLALTGWDSVGNSNWYIFVILICYLISWIGLSISGKSNLKIGLAVYILLSIIVYIILVLYKQSWWYDTFLCFTAGITFSHYKQKIEQLTDKHYWALLIICVLLFAISKYLPYNVYGLRANMNATFFALTVVLMTRKITLKSNILCWMGTMLFPLYIYQRIPMTVFYHIDNGGFVLNHTILYIAVCAIITVAIGYLYRFFSITFK